jgi:hypothetical protein
MLHRLAALVLIFLTVSCGDNKGQLTPDAKVDASIDSTADANPSDQIAAAKMTADGTLLTLPIGYAVVTYIKPALGNVINDPAGFTVQASKMGPGIFVAVDPATTNPVLARGDVISFTVTDLVTIGGQKRVSGISNLTRISTGFDVTTLSQDVSSVADLVSAIDMYDSELVDVTGTIAVPGNSGSGFQKFQLTTTGLTSPMLVVRFPSTLLDAVDFATTCTVTLKDTPVGRFGTETQLAAFAASDVTLSGCPAPTVVGAVDVSSTSISITFSRNIAPASVMANGSQFTFDNGLVASAATVSGRTVTVTTGAQALGTTYTVTVANTVTDLQGSALVTPATATFVGFEQPASVKLNEVNALITGGCDLIELRVLADGTLRGIRVQERNGGSGELNETLPAVTVAKNDIVILHLNSGNTTTCNPGASTNETTSITQNPVATFTKNYDTAWDLFSADTGLTSTDNVITVFDRYGAMKDAVFIDDDMAGMMVAAATESAAVVAATAMMWQMIGGGIPTGGFVDDNFTMHAVLDSDATGTTNTGDTLRRIDDTDENDKADWAQGAHTWGLINAGQVAIP